MIRKEGSKYALYSKDGSRKLGTFDSKKLAKEREAEINRIKHAKGALVDVEMIITKATLQEDGTMRWQAVASDTGTDRTGERTSMALFDDWIERATTEQSTPWLPAPRMPFLGVSHYPALDGFGEAGPTEKMYVDGDRFKANGTFDPRQPLGLALFEATRNERELIQRGESINHPIRISAAWWDIAHSHGQFKFERKAIDDICPMCANGQGDKQYLKGQLDHLAATRLPINPRTLLVLEEKSMATKKEDAASIVGDELADKLEERLKKVAKSETEQPEGLVIKADEPDIEKGKLGDFIRNRMDELELTVPDIEGQMPISDSTIQEIISGGIETPSEPVLSGFAKVLKVSKGRLKEMLPAGAKPDEEVAQNKADIPVEGEMPPLPLGGATSLTEAQEFMAAQDQVNELHSRWSIFSIVMRNILDTSGPAEIKGRVENLIGEFGDSVAAIKAAMEGAYLMEQSTGDSIMSKRDTPQESSQHPADVMKAAIDGTLANDQLDRTAKQETIQAAFNAYVDTVKAQLDELAPPDIGEQIAAGVEKAMAPIAEQLGLLVAKLNGQPMAQQPQQKSYVPTGPVQRSEVADPTRPQSIKSIVRRSVGIVE